MVDHIVDIYGFAKESIMGEIIYQQQWSDLSDVTMLTLDDTKDLVLTKYDGSFAEKPMAVHVRKLNGFLLYYNRKRKEFNTTLDTDGVMAITETDFSEYCGLPEYHANLAGV